MLCASVLSAQVDEKNYSSGLSARIDSAVIQQYQRVRPFFQEAYNLYPSVPRGVLEAVSFAYTRFTHLTPPDVQPEGAAPSTYGLMGLTLDGCGFFRDNLHYVAELSGFPVEDIISSPRDNVVAYAAAYAALQQQMGVRSNRFDAQLPILISLSELPLSDDSVLAFALNSSLYVIACFTDNVLFRSVVGTTLDRPDYDRCFGSMLPRLRSAKVLLEAGTEQTVRSGSADYDGAIWNPAGACNYTSGRGGHAISAIAIHYTQGTYASSIAWFQNCTYNGVGARASAHYVVRSVDGQVTQMVREADKAWHVGNCNPYTIGIEHEAYGDIASFFTPEMYESSARLVRNICDRNGISPHRMFYRDTLDDGTVLNSGTHSLGGESACVKIRGHQHFPSQSHTDPGPYWNWNYYYKLVNGDTPVTRFDAPSGTLTDSGGADGDYGNDERQLLLIQVEGAQSITLSFREFDLEDNYDFLWVYDGSNVFSPLLGRWNTTSPGTVTSTGNALLLEFRSDCATTAAGWLATWQAALPATNQLPVTEILWNPNQWVSEDFTLDFEDTDDGEIPYRFYQVMGYDGRQWTANPSCGFAYDDFDRLDTRLWSVVRGSWHCDGGRLIQSGTSPSEIALPIALNANNTYLYEFDMALTGDMGAGTSAGLRIGNSGTVSRQGGYYVAAFPDENQVKVYRCQQGRETLLGTVNDVVTLPDVNYHYRVVHAVAVGRISLLRDGVFLGEFQEYASTTIPQNLSGIAFFAAGPNASFDNLLIYRSRDTSVEVTVGNGRNCEIQWQAANGAPTVKARSVIVDNHWFFSETAEKNILVDYTKPLLREPVFLGLNESVEYSPTHTSSFHWTAASDPHSGISCYEYGITGDPEDGITGITWLGTVENNCIGLYPNIRITEPYYFTVRAVNGAELHSDPIFSELCGRFSRLKMAERAVFAEKSLRDGFGQTEFLRLWPNPATEKLNVELTASAVSLSVFDICGREVQGVLFDVGDTVGEGKLELDISALKKGVYFVRSVGRNGSFSFASFVKQ